MPADDLTWLSQKTGFALASVDAEGALRTNDAAEKLLGGRARTLREALAVAASVSPTDHGLEALFRAAEKDGRAARDLGRFRVLLFRDGNEQTALLIPQALEVASDVHRRAAATDLSAAVSHELSNVLGAILGWATLARRTGEPDAKVDRALTLIEKSARSAHATARHLLDTARGRVIVPGSVVDVGALVEEVTEVLSPKADERGVTLHVESTEGLTLRGNRADLFTVVWNLVQNAIEATPERSRVDVRLEGKGQMICLTVTDAGDGIPEDIRGRVFEPYFSTKDDGTGLGLSLVRRAVDSLGGAVALEDTEHGARFTCRFPRSDATELDAPPRRQSGVMEKSSPHGKRILVVDDDEAMRDLLATALGLGGAEVITAASGEEALASVGYFDLVLVDLVLGDLRGDHLLSELREQGRVGASALVSGASLPPNLSASPDRWLRKPFELDDLLSVVASLLEARGTPKDAQSG